MCSRIVTLVFFVILHILTVKNLHRVSTCVHAHRLMRGHAPQVQKCTESEPVYGVLSRYVQQDHDIGFLCHSPYTNSEEPAQSQYRRSRAPSGAWSCSIGAKCTEYEPVYGVWVLRTAGACHRFSFATLYILTVRNCTESALSFPCIVWCIVKL